MFFDGFSFLGGQFVDSINNLVSEFVQGVNDGLEDVLVGEVLVGSQTDQSLDHWCHLGSWLNLGGDVFE